MPATDQGVREGARYQLVPRTLIFVTCLDRVLLIKGAPHKRLWANLYNGIGGHVERGENIGEAARRELYEETGIRSVRMHLVGVITVDTGESPGVGIFVLRGEVDPEDLDSGEPEHFTQEGALEWIQTDQISKLPLVADLHELLPRVLQASSGEAPFFAVFSYDEQDHLQIQFA